MTWQSEFWSWMSPPAVKTAEIPTIGQQAPTSTKLEIPRKDRKPTIITFLRHCGCPFAEKTFLTLRHFATTHPHIHFIAISHSDATSTATWLSALPSPSSNTQPNLEIVVDADREVYAAWGLGTSSFWHVVGSIPSVRKLETEEGIKVRNTESGNRWQTGGSFGVDGEGRVRWIRVDERADDGPDFGVGVEALKV